MHLERGYVHCYTGNGKGKTTAALGLALRAVGAGLKVFIVQFAKGVETSEIEALKKFPQQVTLRQFGSGIFITEPSEEDRLLAAQGLAAVEEAIRSGSHDLVVLDEICGACHCGMIPVARVVELLAQKPAHVEVVCTGRSAPEELLEAADLVTEMREIKHYYRSGVFARKGIEY